MSVGYQIRNNTRKVAPDVVERFRELPVANVSDCMWRMYAGPAQLRPMHLGGRMCGPALTVRMRPGDNLLLHKALDMAKPGDIIVADAGGDVTNALLGEIMLAIAVRQGVAGIVLNGAIRDADAIAQSPLPVFAMGVTHRGPYKDGPGEIGFPIAIGGMTIDPGDLVLGDGDGVLAVAMGQAEAIYRAAKAKQAAEALQISQIAAGTLDRGWIDEALRQAGCEFIDEPEMAAE